MRGTMSSKSLYTAVAVTGVLALAALLPDNTWSKPMNDVAPAPRPPRLHKVQTITRTTQVKRQRGDVERDVPKYTPLDAVKMAYEDALAVAAANDPHVPVQYVRYLSVHNQPKSKRILYKQTVDFTVNSLSKKRIIVRTAALPGNVEDPIVIRINLKDYGISPKAWDSLAENGSGQSPIPEPYFHQFITNPGEEEYEEEYETTTVYETKWVTNEFGQQVQQRVPVEKKVKTGRKVKKKAYDGKPSKIYAAASWLAHQDGGKLITNLIGLTQTRNPVVRADWFTVYAWWAPQYYVLLGLDPKGGTDQFDQLVAADDRAKLSQVASITNTKIVALHNRILIRIPTINGYVGGYYWATNDTDKGIDDEDYLNNIATFDHPKIAAQELIGTLLNTLQVYALADGKKNLLNVANASIAIHSDVEPTKLADKQVYAGRNCVFCHKEGIYPIKCQFRDISQRKIALFVAQRYGKKVDEKTAEKIQDAFAPSQDGVVTHDQAIYTTAIKACNNLAPGVNAAQLETLTWGYYDAPITMERLAWDVGWPVDKLDTALRLGVGLDHTVTGLLQDPPVRPDILTYERQGFQALELFLIGIEVEAAKRHLSVDKFLEPYLKKK
jgi:hypothetical protein